MVLANGDKALIREIAWEVADQLTQRVHQRMDEQIRLHAAECPHGRRLSRVLWMILGAALGGSAGGGGLMYLVTRLL